MSEINERKDFFEKFNGEKRSKFLRKIYKHISLSSHRDSSFCCFISCCFFCGCLFCCFSSSFRLSKLVEFFSIVVEVVEVLEFVLVYGLVHIPIVGLPVVLDLVNSDFACPLFLHLSPFFFERSSEAGEVARWLVNLGEFSLCTSNFSFSVSDVRLPAFD